MDIPSSSAVLASSHTTTSFGARTCNGGQVALCAARQLHGPPQVAHVAPAWQCGGDGDDPVVQRAVKGLSQAGLQRLQEDSRHTDVSASSSSSAAGSPGRYLILMC